MKVKNILLFCSPGGRGRIKDFERYGPELAPRKDRRSHHPHFSPSDRDRPPLIHGSSHLHDRGTRSRNSSGSGGSSLSSSGSSFGRSTFYDVEISNNSGTRRPLGIDASESPIPTSASSDEQNVLENLDNYDLSSLAHALEGPKLEVGDRVLWYREPPCTNEFGIVRWLGDIGGEEIAGIEFDNELGIGSGWYKNEFLFECKPNYGGLVAVVGLILEKDIVQEEHTSCVTEPQGEFEAPYWSSYQSPAPADSANMPTFPFLQSPLQKDDADRIDGCNRGIQGNRNSCYLDATLFAMFSFTPVFDSILITPCDAPNLTDAERKLAHNVQRILREEIVNPLRKNLFTPAANVMKLRETMKHLDYKLISEEMDPSEFLEILFRQVLHLREFLSLSSGESDYFHQVLCNADAENFPTVQRLFEESLIGQNLKLKSTPTPVLILQMPRSGPKVKMFKGILPNLSIDITDFIEDTPRMCIICGSLATAECRDCAGILGVNVTRREDSSSRTPLGAEAFSTAFCDVCVNRAHARADRRHHASRVVPITYSFDPDLYFPRSPVNSSYSTSRSTTNGIGSPDYNPASSYFPPERYSYGLPLPPSPPPSNSNSPFHVPSLSFAVASSNGSPVYITSQKSIPRVTMDLFAVICIETSHFVSFVRCGREREAPWAFFDSMADRSEVGSGYNIPQVKILPQMGRWLSSLEKDFGQESLETCTPELKRLLSDPYICLYYSPLQAMYS